jgi:hypothetical protein
MGFAYSARGHLRRAGTATVTLMMRPSRTMDAVTIASRRVALNVESGMARTPIANQALLTEPELRARLSEMYDAIDQYNRRWYFESHETLEDLWMVTPWPEQRFMQAIIQLAAAFVHFVRGEYPGVVKLLDESARKLQEFLPEQFGVDTAALLADVDRVRSEIAALGEVRFREFDERNVPQIIVRSETR